MRLLQVLVGLGLLLLLVVVLVVGMLLKLVSLLWIGPARCERVHLGLHGAGLTWCSAS